MFENGYEVKIGVEYALTALKNESKEKYEKRSKKPRYRSIKPLAVTTLTSTTTTALPFSQCQILKEKLDKENQRKKQQQSSKASTNQIPKIPLKNVSTNAQIPSTMTTTMDGSGGVIKPNKITEKLAPKSPTDDPDGNVDRSLKQLRIVSSTQSSFKVIPRPINIQQQSKQ
ncbi:unnamed protein product [Didymodactylos carnosus]|uniref:Uncharacterized protein n=1 Tax=Didymodactylos carnosus TaxID=1234261 RepID=A0A8S2RID5_9BILA|nr:unnamed protein product [Didymodactylos carnosus]CAF4162572.1 unnamed protein product [Didymodactylos carnosus]